MRTSNSSHNSIPPKEPDHQAALANARRLSAGIFKAPENLRLTQLKIRKSKEPDSPLRLKARHSGFRNPFRSRASRRVSLTLIQHEVAHSLGKLIVHVENETHRAALIKEYAAIQELWGSANKKASNAEDLRCQVNIFIRHFEMHLAAEDKTRASSQPGNTNAKATTDQASQVARKAANLAPPIHPDDELAAFGAAIEAIVSDGDEQKAAPDSNPNAPVNELGAVPKESEHLLDPPTKPAISNSDKVDAEIDAMQLELEADENASTHPQQNVAGTPSSPKTASKAGDNTSSNALATTLRGLDKAMLTVKQVAKPQVTQPEERGAPQGTTSMRPSRPSVPKRTGFVSLDQAQLREKETKASH